MRPKVRFLNDELIERIISEAKEVLRTLGIEIHNNTILSLLSDFGANIDMDKSHVIITEDLINKALETVPHSFNLSDYRGKVVVLDLMATWCGPCISEMEHLKYIFNNYNSSEVVIMSIGVDTREDNEKLRSFKLKYGGDWIFARDIDNVGEKYDVEYIPKLVVIDKSGMIRYENVWTDREQDPVRSVIETQFQIRCDSSVQ